MTICILKDAETGPFMDYRRDKYNYIQIRERSLEIAAKLGFNPSDALPLLDDSLALRPIDAIVSRSLALLCVVVASYGFGRQDVIQRWLSSEHLVDCLTSDEKDFLFNGETTYASEYKSREECLWAFTWALGFHDEFSFSSYCQPTLSAMFPRFTEGESSSDFRSRSRLRSELDIVTQLDLAYCIHWCLTENKLQGSRKRAATESYVVIQRRHALEWMLSQEDWNRISLDT